jgi:hypothetical protein
MVQVYYLAMNLNKIERRKAFILALAAFVVVLVRTSALASPPTQSTSCLTAPVAPDPSPTVCVSQAVAQVDARSEKNYFYVSWRTQNPEKGQVRLAGGRTYHDVRGEDFEGRTHYVRVEGLRAKSSTQFDIVSGGETYTNGGDHWTGELGEAVEESAPYFIIGHVTNPNGNGANGALVYAQIRDGDAEGTPGRTGLLSALIVLEDGGDIFNINLGLARKQNNLQPFSFEPDSDRVFLTAIGPQGSVSEQFIISDLHPPRPPPSLMLAREGTGTVATATATIIPDTATPTLTPTLTETPTATPTNTLAPPTETQRPRPTRTPEVLPTETSAPTALPTIPTGGTPTPGTTIVALPAEGQFDPRGTRVFGGVPNIQPPPPAPNNTLIFIGLALVLFVGAVLLGLAAFFVARR